MSARLMPDLRRIRCAWAFQPQGTFSDCPGTGTRTLTRTRAVPQRLASSCLPQAGCFTEERVWIQKLRRGRIAKPLRFAVQSRVEASNDRADLTDTRASMSRYAEGMSCSCVSANKRTGIQPRGANEQTQKCVVAVCLPWNWGLLPWLRRRAIRASQYACSCRFHRAARRTSSPSQDRRFPGLEAAGRVDNRPSAAVSSPRNSARADGRHTLMKVTIGHAVNASLYTKLRTTHQGFARLRSSPMSQRVSRRRRYEERARSRQPREGEAGTTQYAARRRGQRHAMNSRIQACCRLTSCTCRFNGTPEALTNVNAARCSISSRLSRVRAPGESASHGVA